MDTRTKITRVDEWSPRAGEEWVVVVGGFDPFTTEVANAITTHARPGAKLAVAVAERDQTLLSREARAILIAALGAVDAVFNDADDAEPVLERALTAGVQASVADERVNDERRSREFSDFVVARQQVAYVVPVGKRGE